MTKTQAEAPTKGQKYNPDNKINGQEIPTLQEIKDCIPKELFKKDECKFLIYVGYSLSLTLACYFLGKAYIPLEAMYIPLWMAYAVVTGTVATGLWVLGHECGHKAFSNNDLYNDLLGFFIHTPLLVPYFSWQHSHHVHHMKCNHTEVGETHVPIKVNSAKAESYQKLKSVIGEDAFAILQMNLIAWIGWPVYLLLGVTGGPERGFTSHFIVPNKLFPKDKLMKVGISNAGLCAVIFLLYKWAQATSFAHVMALYGGPYLIVNCWLTIYTFLQHTDKDIAHYDHRQWTWLKGALSTIDRNYPGYINALHFDIGSSHVVHHVFHEMPFFHANIATLYVKQRLGKLYNFDPKPVWTSFFNSAKLVAIKDDGDGTWRF